MLLIVNACAVWRDTDKEDMIEVLYYGMACVIVGLSVRGMACVIVGLSVRGMACVIINTVASHQYRNHRSWLEQLKTRKICYHSWNLVYQGQVYDGLCELDLLK